MISLSHGNILAVYFYAADNEIISGIDWYGRANRAAQNMAQRYSLPLVTVAGVIAALSPNNRWERNLRDADQLCRAYVMGGASDAQQVKTSTYNANKIKALAILSGAAPLEALGGLKVRSFYGCIMGDPGAVCVDGHAYAIWQGSYVPTTKTPKISAKLYASISADYVNAASTINAIVGASYTGAQIQAITWTVWQRIRRQVNKGA